MSLDEDIIHYSKNHWVLKCTRFYLCRRVSTILKKWVCRFNKQTRTDPWIVMGRRREQSMNWLIISPFHLVPLSQLISKLEQILDMWKERLIHITVEKSLLILLKRAMTIIKILKNSAASYSKILCPAFKRRSKNIIIALRKNLSNCERNALTWRFMHEYVS